MRNDRMHFHQPGILGIRGTYLPRGIAQPTELHQTLNTPTYGERSRYAKTVVCCSRNTAGGQLGSMRECGRRTSSWLSLIAKIHSRDTACVQSEYVENFAVR